MRRLRKLEACAKAFLNCWEQKRNPMQPVSYQFTQNKFADVKISEYVQRLSKKMHALFFSLKSQDLWLNKNKMPRFFAKSQDLGKKVKEWSHWRQV